MAAQPPSSSTVISWNVNGLRACLRKQCDPTAPTTRFDELVQAYPDCVCIALQETKMQGAMWDGPKGVRRQIAEQLPGWQVCCADSAAKKGYSGTALLLRHPPDSVELPRIGCGADECGQDAGEEGRVVAAVYAHYAIVSVYTCNSARGGGLGRLKYRTECWDAAFRQYCADLLQAHRAADPAFHLIVAGDLNVAHADIDLARPDENRNKTAGFTDAERAGLCALMDGCELRDSFRELHPGAVGAYSWWPYRVKTAREQNVGWRIDYILTTVPAERVVGASILSGVHGSDHCPVLATFDTI